MSCSEASMGKYGWRYLARPTLSQLHRHQLKPHPPTNNLQRPPTHKDKENIEANFQQNSKFGWNSKVKTRLHTLIQ